MTVATGGGAKVESHPIILSPMSRTQSAVAPPTPHGPPADAQLPGTAEEQHDEVAADDQEQSHREDAITPAAGDALPEPAADQGEAAGQHDVAENDAAHDAVEPADPSPAADAPTQTRGKEAGAAQGAETAWQGGDEAAADAGDSESDPSTPVAVRDALAAVHSLAISTGAFRIMLHEAAVGLASWFEEEVWVCQWLY